MRPDDQEAVDILLEKNAYLLSTWEIDFLESIDGRGLLTPKQKAKLDDIWRDVVKEKNRR